MWIGGLTHTALLQQGAETWFHFVPHWHQVLGEVECHLALLPITWFCLVDGNWEGRLSNLLVPLALRKGSGVLSSWSHATLFYLSGVEWGWRLLIETLWYGIWMGSKNRNAASSVFNHFIRSLCCYLVWRFRFPLGLTDTRSRRKWHGHPLNLYFVHTWCRVGVEAQFSPGLADTALVGKLEHILSSAREKWKINSKIIALTLPQSGELEYTTCFYGVGMERYERSAFYLVPGPLKFWGGEV